MDLPRILVVEDDILIAAEIAETVTDAGFEAVQEHVGESALDQLGSDHESLSGLVTDISLGGPVDGWEIAHRARELKPAMAVVYVSGQDPDIWAAKGVPNSVLIAKPFAAAQIAVALANLLNRSDAVL